MNPLRKNPSVYFLIACLFFSSNCIKENHVTRSYYYWRNSNYITLDEKAFVKENGIKKIYKKILDVDWNETMHAFPVSSSEIAEFNYDLNYIDSLHINIIPVIFITNKTFLNIDRSDIPQLATRIIRRCLPAYDTIDMDYDERHQTYHSKHTKPLYPEEIQFDCDWTSSTQKTYFYFLETVRALLPSKDITISATIRLHQYKYTDKTGIPPVNRGMLMLYNITDLREKSNFNSIFDYNKAKVYFTANKKYPLPLDIALPAYSWCIIFRNNKFYQIENAVTEKDLKNSTFLEPTANKYYKVTADTVFRDIFLRIGDEIKNETINENTLKQAAELSMKAINNQTFSVSLFELSSDEIKQYKNETIESVYSSYR